MLPDLKKPGWRKRRFYAEMGTLSGAIVSGFFAAYKLYPIAADCPPCPPAPSAIPFVAALLGIVFIVIAGAFKLEQAKEKDAEDDEVKGPASLVGCLHGLHGALLGHKGLDTANGKALRVTVHKVLSRKELEQLTPYVGGEGGPPGQKLGSCGLVGAAILRGKTCKMVREKGRRGFKKYVDELVNDYFVPLEVAQEMRQDRMSFLAVPLKDAKEKVVGAVFLDSCEPDFFDDATVECVVNGCAGIVKFLHLNKGRR